MSFRAIYVPWIPFGFDGVACRWFYIIKSSHREDQGLHEHERLHCMQMKTDGVVKYLWRYFTDDLYRAQVEYAAFKYGSKYSDTRIQGILVNRYRIPLGVARRVCNG